MPVMNMKKVVKSMSTAELKRESTNGRDWSEYHRDMFHSELKKRENMKKHGTIRTPRKSNPFGLSATPFGNPRAGKRFF